MKREKRERRERMDSGGQEKCLRVVMECFSTELSYYEGLLSLRSFREKIKKEKKSIKNVERIFLNVDGVLEISFSLLCSFEDLLTNFFKERKERRGEKWDLNQKEKREEEEEGAEEQVVKDKKELEKRFQIEMDEELVWLAKEEKETEEREEPLALLEVGEIFLEHLPLFSREYGLFILGKCSFHLFSKLKTTEPFQSFRNSRGLDLECLFVMPQSRLPRYSLLLTFGFTSSQQERSLIQCYLLGFRGWAQQVNSILAKTERMEKIGENKLAKKIEDFWGCFLPEPEEKEKIWPTCWTHSGHTHFLEEWSSTEEQCCSSVLQGDPKDIIKFMNVLEELHHEALAFENKLTKEGKDVSRFCEIFLEFCPRFTDLFSQWRSCLILFVDCLKGIQSHCDFKKMSSLETLFSTIFKPLTRLVIYVSALQTLDWDGVKKKDQEILSKTLVCYRQVVEIPADTFGKLKKKGRFIKRASPS